MEIHPPVDLRPAPQCSGNLASLGRLRFFLPNPRIFEYLDNCFFCPLKSHFAMVGDVFTASHPPWVTCHGSTDHHALSTSSESWPPSHLTQHRASSSSLLHRTSLCPHSHLLLTTPPSHLSPSIVSSHPQSQPHQHPLQLWHEPRWHNTLCGWPG
jgi:hypothetical protein